MCYKERAVMAFTHVLKTMLNILAQKGPVWDVGAHLGQAWMGPAHDFPGLFQSTTELTPYPFTEKTRDGKKGTGCQELLNNSGPKTETVYSLHFGKHQAVSRALQKRNPPRENHPSRREAAARTVGERASACHDD